MRFYTLFMTRDSKNHTLFSGTCMFRPRYKREGNCWGAFLERHENFSGTKANFKIKTCWIVAPLLAHKPVNCASLTDYFDSLQHFQNFWNFDILIANPTNIKQLSGSNKLPGLSRNRSLGRVNYGKDFWECYWRQGKKSANSWPTRP